jgi:Ca-activated chloride channel family protein
MPVPAAGSFVAVSSWRSVLWWLPEGMRLVVLAALIVALARPRMQGAEVASGEGVDIMLVLDVSASMNAIDITRADLEAMLGRDETPRNRFVIARDILRQFIADRNRAGSDRIGLAVFGAEAWLRYPLTHDHARLVRSLDEVVLDAGIPGRDGKCINQCTVSGAGTAIGDALGRAYNQLRRAPDSKSRVVILITDGKEQGGSLKAEAVARHLRDLPPDEKVRVYTFLVGGRGEIWLPDLDRLGRQYRSRDGYPRYAQPQQPFEIDPDLLKEIADQTGGKFYDSYNEAKFRDDIADLERTAFESKVERPLVDVFEWPLLFAFLLLLFERLLAFTLFRSIT